mmetsp:Transcript_17024/g.54125  ORF Transcript_17024/g.54125 Transcript_17024/m.54125 type:complete len:175 (+) Transcript_17024:59-583(+)
MSAWRAFRRPMNILERTERLMRARAIKKPLWFDVVKQYPPDPPLSWAPKPQPIRFPEDDLLERYYRKNPEAKKAQRLNLFNKSKKPPAVLFVTRQLELMETEKISEEAAYKRVEAEMGPLHAIGVAGQQISAEDDSVPLGEQFDRWMNAESNLWRRQGQRDALKKSKRNLKSRK